MGRKLKMPKPKCWTSEILQENLARLIPEKFPDLEYATERNEAIAQIMGMDKETVRRTINGQTICNLRTLELFAVALGTSTIELIRPSRDHRERHERLMGTRAIAPASRLKPRAVARRPRAPKKHASRPAAAASEGADVTEHPSTNGVVKMPHHRTYQ